MALKGVPPVDAVFLEKLLSEVVHSSNGDIQVLDAEIEAKLLHIRALRERRVDLVKRRDKAVAELNILRMYKS
jgi:hypothetical protein